jgi:hypothetical protein
MYGSRKSDKLSWFRDNQSLEWCVQRISSYQFYSLWFNPTGNRTHDLPRLEASTITNTRPGRPRLKTWISGHFTPQWLTQSELALNNNHSLNQSNILYIYRLNKKVFKQMFTESDKIYDIYFKVFASRGHRGHDRMVQHLCNLCLSPVKLWIRTPFMAWIQHNVIKFVSDIWQVVGFLRVLRLPPPIKLTATI